jgi:hypothetical protein
LTSTLKPLLAEAIALRGLALELQDYLSSAAGIQTSIMEVIGREANHPAIQSLQNIFR